MMGEGLSRLDGERRGMSVRIAELEQRLAARDAEVARLREALTRIAGGTAYPRYIARDSLAAEPCPEAERVRPLEWLRNELRILRESDSAALDVRCINYADVRLWRAAQAALLDRALVALATPDKGEELTP